MGKKYRPTTSGLNVMRDIIDRDTAEHLIALAQLEAENHRPDEKRGGCTCGFCVWSVEHVLVMSMREVLM